MSTPVATLLPLVCLQNFAAALDFIQWLKKTNQSGWQLLPLSHPITTPYRNQGIGLSPYFFDSSMPPEWRRWTLTREEFVFQNRFWLADYAHFQALVQQLGTDQWWTWPPDLRDHHHATLAASRLRLETAINGFIDQQYFLYNQLSSLRRYALENEITLIGDLPFYLARESSLVWAHQSLFLLGEGGQMRLQSGVPAAPDEPFAEQYWGHPLYDWENNDITDVMRLFNERLQFMRGFTDLVRIDHANGFFKYGAMSREHQAWNRKLQGPGKPAVMELLRDLQNFRFGVYFEDIASDKMRLEQFMKEYDVVGSSVLTLIYNVEAQKPLDPEKIKDQELQITALAGNKIMFTSTHDTPPILPWVQKLPPEIKQRLKKVNNLRDDLDDRALAGALRDLLITQEARMAIIPWQDWWLDSWRFNVPGHEELTRWDYQVDIKKYLARV